MMNYIRQKPKAKFNLFAVTVTLDPYFCSRYNFTEQYDLLLPEIIKDIERFPTQMHNVYVSFELTQDKNIHVHLAVETGFALTYTVARHLIDLVFSRNNMYGHNKVVPIYNDFGWHDYCNKGQYYQEHYAYAF